VQTDEFDYILPDDSIAQSAIEPRHSSRVLVASDRSEIRFLSLASLFSPGDLLVVNRTKVRAARLSGRRVPTGGACEMLLTRRLDDVRWTALVKGSKRLHAGSVIQCGTMYAVVMSDPIDGVVTVELSSNERIEDAIATQGRVPLPPYFHGSLDSDERYQTMFASTLGSSAAPTAALHFTQDVVERLNAAGIEIAEVELQVGLDTFRPISSDRVEDHRMHSEHIVVKRSAVEAVARCRARGGRVIAVGTTVVRTLESARCERGQISEIETDTQLFISPGYRFGVVDGLITNFHAPRTSLLVMISAIVGEEWRSLYEYALSERFRFLSFGDALYLEVHR